MQDIPARIASIRDDHDHGSRWLVRQTILLLRDLAIQPAISPEDQLARIWQTGRELAQARPAMAAIAGAVGRILTAPGGLPGVARAAELLLQEIDQSMTRLTSFARPHLRGTIMTHSLSGTILHVLKACIPPVDHLIILEGRPLYEGRTAARAFLDTSIKVTLITDAQADIFLPLCQAVVVGADSILADGGILNKSGTALLAWAASGYQIPFFVLAETLKISPQVWTRNLTLLEEKSSQEVWAQAPDGLAVRNFYFDYTPARLISQILTEQGPLTPMILQDQVARLNHVIG